MNYKVNNIKYLFLDLDDTLVYRNLLSHNNINPKNIEALKEYCSGDRKIILSTGRCMDMTWMVFRKLKKLGFTKEQIPYFICMNGGEVWDTKDLDKPIMSQCFGESLVSRILEILEESKFDYFAITNNHQVIHPPRFISYVIYHLQMKHWHGKNVVRSEFPKNNIQKIIILGGEDKIKKFQKKIDGEFKDALYVSHCYAGCWEIIDRSIDKVNGIRYLSKKLGVGMDEFCAMGNGRNDMQSLINVGLGVGIDMEEPRSNKIAIHVDSSRGDGVWRGIEEMKTRKLL